MPKLRHVPRHERLACLPGPSRISGLGHAPGRTAGAHDGHVALPDLPQLSFLALAALAGLAVGGWLTLLTHRLPRMMEREWQAHCQESAEPAAATEPACARSMACARRSRIVRNARRRSGLAPVAAGGLAAAQCARACGAAIGWRYPAIELLTAVLFAACAWRFGPTPIALCGMGLSASLVALAWIDLESTLLPDAITLPLAWAGLLVNLGDGFTPLPLAVLGAVAGYGFLWLIFHAFRYFTGREGMGYGDLLLAALGAWFGWARCPCCCWRRRWPACWWAVR